MKKFRRAETTIRCVMFVVKKPLVFQNWSIRKNGILYGSIAAPPLPHIYVDFLLLYRYDETLHDFPQKSNKTF